MKRGLSVALILSFLAAGAAPALAGSCVGQGLFSETCEDALTAQLAQAQKLVSCIKAMQCEYNGCNSEPGAGPAFAKKKKECRRLADQIGIKVSADSATADNNSSPSDDGSVDEAVERIKEWANSSN